MAKKVTGQGGLEALWNPGEANEKQKLFYQSRTLFTAYGGAKGGGKTHAVRIKAVGGALANPGIKILIIRAHFRELDENHIQPICNMVLPLHIATYNDQKHRMTFENGSTIQFGNWVGEDSETTYNGLEYDWIFMDEATQFSERAFNFLGGCLRGVNEFPKRFYLTCNPGGVGHRWVKRLFIDQNYRTNCENPEENENPEDYTFIPATVEDNKHMLESSPLYLRNLANMPEDVRRAYRYGDWDAIGGNYFKEFSNKTHMMKQFAIPEKWPRYRSFDYGLDMFACFWWTIDTDGRCWCTREFEKKDLIAPDAAKAAIEHTLPSEKIIGTYAPPDMWSRQKDTGRMIAESFTQNGVPLIKASNNRVQGHMLMKEMLAPMPLKDPDVMRLWPPGQAPAMLPGLMFFDTLEKVAEDIQSIQASEKDPNDCATQPHEITHTVDGIRYFIISRKLAAEAEKAAEAEEYDDDGTTDYDEYMTGGDLSASYMNY